MTENRVSVLVTFYNQEKYVDTALQSVFSQKTDFGVKVIVGDDGSSDRTCEIVNQWIERYPDNIELHIMERGEGKQIPGFRASRNRLNLLQYVDTDYFNFLDGDDYFTCNTKLQRQVEILDLADNSDCIACGHNVYRSYSDGRNIPATDPNLKEGKVSPEYFWSKAYIHTDSLMFRSSFIPEIKVKLLENSFNDTMITLSAVQHGMIYYIPEIWAIYLQTADGIWTSGNAVVNHVRNIIFYDLATKVNPKLKMHTICRFGYVWKGLFKLRKSIDPSSLTAYYNEAKDKGCKNAILWISYPDLNPFQKIGLLVKTFFIRCSIPVIKHMI